MGRVASAEQEARVKARQRRVETLAQNRRERDRRIEAAAAEVFLGLRARALAGEQLREAEGHVAAGLRRLLAEQLDLGQAAQLCELTVQDARRLSRHRRARGSTPTGTDAGDGAGGVNVQSSDRIVIPPPPRPQAVADGRIPVNRPLPRVARNRDDAVVENTLF